MQSTHTALAGALLLSCATLAHAGTTTVDFTGFVSLVGASQPGSSLPDDYDPIDGLSSGDTVVGWFSFNNDPAAYDTVWGTPGSNGIHDAGASPLLNNIHLSFPAYDFSIDLGDLPSLIPDVGPAITQRLQVLNVSSRDAVSLFNRWDNRPSGGYLEGSYGVRLEDDSATAFADSTPPTVLDLAAFNERVVGLTDRRTSAASPFVPDRSIYIEARLDNPDAVPIDDIFAPKFDDLGTFESKTSGGGPAGWTTSDTGVVEVVDLAGGNGVVSLTTGSPVSIEQALATPDSAFEIAFDYEFLTTSGELEVSLDGTLLGTIAAPAALAGAFDLFVLAVTDPALQNLGTAALKFELNGLTTSQIYLDNITANPIQAVPVPPLVWLFASFAAVALRRHRPRR